MKSKSLHKIFSFGLLIIMQNVYCDVKEKPDLIDVQSINSNIRVELRYATENNFTGKCVYPKGFNTCYVLKIVAEKLDLVQKELETKDLGLKVWDGLRTFNAQKRFYFKS